MHCPHIPSRIMFHYIFMYIIALQFLMKYIFEFLQHFICQCINNTSGIFILLLLLVQILKECLTYINETNNDVRENDESRENMSKAIDFEHIQIPLYSSAILIVIYSCLIEQFLS